MQTKIETKLNFLPTSKNPEGEDSSINSLFSKIQVFALKDKKLEKNNLFYCPNVWGKLCRPEGWEKIIAQKVTDIYVVQKATENYIAQRARISSSEGDERYLQKTKQNKKIIL